MGEKALVQAADSSLIASMKDRPKLFGRHVIKLSYKEINRGNVLEAAGKVLAIYDQNVKESRWLWNYYIGIQPILTRVKGIRPEINNKMVMNVANEIVSFNVGYRVGEPIQYVGRSKEDKVTDGIVKLNNWMFAEEKASKDQEVVECQNVCGTAYRMVLPSQDEDAESPFELFSLNPEEAFVAYSTGLGKKPMMGGTIFEVDGGYEMTIYTTDKVFVIRGKREQIVAGAKEVKVTEIPHALGMIPVFEYPANRARLGAFEIVIDLLDALNTLESNRLDGVEQQIQSFLKFVNCQIDNEGMAKLRELGAIMIKSINQLNADVDTVKNDLDQSQTQTLKNDIYQSILTICGIPNRNGGSSTSDTGSAVIFRDGWESAESRAKDFEHVFKRSERKMLRLVLKLCRELEGVDLKMSDLDMTFTRRNYENIQSKSQVLVAMLGQARVHPKLAFEHCGMFSDPESAYKMSEQYYQEQMKAWTPEQVNEHENNEADTGGAV